MPENRPVRCAPVGEVPDELGGLGPLGVGTAPDSVCPAVDFAVFPALAVASLSTPVAVCVGDPVAGTVDLGASEIRVGDEELTVTDGAGDSPAFTLVVDLRAPEDEPEAAEPPDPPEGVDSVGATEVELGRDVETAAEIEGDETEVEIGWDADSSEPGPGACTETARVSAPAAPAPQAPRAAATSPSEILLPAAIIRNTSNVRP